MYGAYKLWEVESQQQSTELRDNFVRSEILFRELLEELGGSKELSFYKDLIT